MMPFRLFLALLTLCWVVLLPLESRAEAVRVVRVGAVHFPPYVVRPENGQGNGLLGDLIAALNQSQKAWEFVMVPTSITRRFRDFTQGRIDMVVFENPDWDWHGIAHDTVDMGLEDAEIFVARREPGRRQDYFTDLAGKHLALFSGYHYGFARNNVDPAYLTTNFRATLTYSHESNLLMVVRGRVDIAPMTRSFLNDALARSVVRADQLLISERVDQVYRHCALLRSGAPISAGQLNALLGQLRASGRMAGIFEPYGVQVTDSQVRPAGEKAGRTAKWKAVN